MVIGVGALGSLFNEYDTINHEPLCVVIPINSTVVGGQRNHSLSLSLSLSVCVYSWISSCLLACCELWLVVFLQMRNIPSLSDLYFCSLREISASGY